MTGASGGGTGQEPGARVEGLVERLAALVTRGPAGDAAWPELAVAHLDLAHLAVHLEGNDRHLGTGAVADRARAAITDPGHSRRAASALGQTRSADDRWSLAPWAAEMSRVGAGRDVVLRAEVAAATAEIAGVLAAIDDDRRALVERVLGRAVPGHPAAAVARALAAVADPGVRGKVAAAWRRLGHRREPDLVAAVDRAVAARRRHAAQEGHGSVVAQTMARCGVDASAVEAFLVENLDRARNRRRAVTRLLCEMTGATEAPLLHLARAATAVRGDAPAPRLPLEGCVVAAAAVARRVFGVDLESARTSAGGPLVLSVRGPAGAVGNIQVDVVTSGRRAHRSVEDGDVIAESATGRTAHVLALVEVDDRGPVLGFDVARSLFHEFGHALDHVLLRDPWPTQTGLDALPLEQFEEMSTWWELLAFHPDLGRVVGLDPELDDGLDRARRVRVLEAASQDLARAWVALLDLRLHRSDGASVADVQADLVAGRGDSDPPDLATVAGYLVAMVFRQHPGAGFLYPWAAARAAELAGDLVGTRWEELAPTPGTNALLEGRVSPRASSRVPSAAALDALPAGVGV